MEDIEQPNEANIQRAMIEIPEIFKPRKTINKKFSSLVLKHTLEKNRKINDKYLNNYIRCSDFEIAMDRLGYKSKKMKCMGQLMTYYFISDIVKNII